MKLPALLAVLALAVAPAVAEDAPDPEIAHLLAAIAASHCVFIRNGKPHTAGEAVEHLEMKYRRAGKRIVGAESFIDRIASASSLSGRPYMIDCDGTPRPTREWLTAELAAYRDAL